MRFKTHAQAALLLLGFAAAAHAQNTVISTTHATDRITAATGRDGKPLPSPRHLLEFNHASTGAPTKISISYGAPSMRGRTVYGDVVPYGHWWRAGANEATGLTTTRTILIGGLTVPAGSYTLYALPAESGWQLILNKQTGQWGTEYDQSKDLGRVPMTAAPLSTPQETLSYTFDHDGPRSAMLHLRWGDRDEAVPVEFPAS